MPKVLTQRVIDAMRSGDYRADAGCPGLRVVAYLHGKAFVYRYRDAGTGKLKQVTIGDASVMPIADARDQVRDLQRSRKAGADPRRTFQAPIEQKVVDESLFAYRVRDLVGDYCRECLARTKRGDERERMLRLDLAPWFTREAASITRGDVKGLLDAIVERDAPDIAGRILRELRAAYGHALDKERIPEGTDPTAAVKAPKESRYVPRDRAFTESEWKKWLRWLPKSGMSRDIMDALMLVALTACRPGEATSARWADIDLEGATWRISERKRDGSHLVFLSRPAVKLLKARAGKSDVFVFPSPTRRDKPIREHAVVWQITEVRDDCPVAHWTAHDIRRSAATLMQAQGVRFEIVRRVLGHYSMRSPTDIYARHGFDDEAREAWAKLGRALTRLGGQAR